MLFSSKVKFTEENILKAEREMKEKEK